MNKNINNLTFQDYLDKINPGGTMHSSTAYTSESVGTYKHESPFDKTIHKFKRFGVEFSVKEQVEDRWENYNNYCKKGDDGEYLRDDNHQLINHTPESIKEVIPEEERFSFEHAVYDETNGGIMAARTQDEWGALLVRTATQYEGFGLGEELLYHHRKVYPFRQSGGYTPQGLHCIKKVFKRYVEENNNAGIYDSLDVDRKQEILSSVEGINTFEEKYKDKIDIETYDFSKSSDRLYHISDRFILIYNKKLFEFLDNDVDIYHPKNDFFINNGILGYVDVLGNDESNRIFKMHYRSPEIKEQLMSLFAQQLDTDNFEIYKRDIHEFKDNTSLFKVKNGRDFATVCINRGQDINLKALQFIENKYRKSKDFYDEKWYLIHERADSLAENHLELNNKLYNEKNKKSKIKP